MKILQINSVSNYGSTGKIVEHISAEIKKSGNQSFIAYGRNLGNPSPENIRIGNTTDNIIHKIGTQFTGKHGKFSRSATQNFIKEIEKIKPDIIHLHNLHGYYINYEVLFNYIKNKKIPVVWTLHDCWSVTGHCSHFEYVQCFKWKSHCENCVQINEYPKSFVDSSSFNFVSKKNSFSGNNFVTLVPVSKWLSGVLEESFLGNYKREVIYNGVDLQTFTPSQEKFLDTDKKIVLAVSSVWTEKKGWKDVLQLSELLDAEFQLVIVGINAKQESEIPKNVIGIRRTENIQDLVKLYSQASVYINPTLEDTFPTTNLEALACGTPVITYKTGGSVESVDENTGQIVEKENIEQLCSAIKEVVVKDRNAYRENCRKKAETLFDKEKNFKKYIELYKNIVNNEN